MIFPVPTEWKNKIHVPNHQPALNMLHMGPHEVTTFLCFVCVRFKNGDIHSGELWLRCMLMLLDPLVIVYSWIISNRCNCGKYPSNGLYKCS